MRAHDGEPGNRLNWTLEVVMGADRNVVVLVMLFALSLTSAWAESCPQAKQPELSRGLESLIKARRADDAMQCVISISSHIRDTGLDVNDEVKYQLAKQASDAIDSLGGDTVVFPEYNIEATRLWQEYLDGVLEPYDRSRLTFAVTKIMQHARLGAFHEIFPSLALGISKSRAWVTPLQSDQLFATLKRCPQWNNTTYTGLISCESPCPLLANSLLSDLASKLGPGDTGTTPGMRRLFANAKAMKESLICPRR
jgi:hypothetical protein